MIYPLHEKYDWREFLTEDQDGNYTVKKHTRIVMSLPDEFRGVNLYHVDDDFIMKVEKGLLIQELNKGYRIDGVTCAIDTDDRMLFAVSHDPACTAGQKQSNPLFEKVVESVAYPFIRKQGRWWNWFRAKRTEWAVKNYESWRNAPTIIK